MKIDYVVMCVIRDSRFWFEHVMRQISRSWKQWEAMLSWAASFQAAGASHWALSDLNKWKHSEDPVNNWAIGR